MTLETHEDAEYHFAALVSIIANSCCSGLDCKMCIFSHEKEAVELHGSETP